MDAYTTALTLLSRRELSTRQLRERLAKRQFDKAAIDEVIGRLSSDGTLDDRRVAFAYARADATLKRHGRRRVSLHLQRLGIDAELAKAAIDDVFGDLDEHALLDAAIVKRLRGVAPAALDASGRAKLVRHLIARGFEPSQVFARLRHRGGEPDE